MSSIGMASARYVDGPGAPAGAPAATPPAATAATPPVAHVVPPKPADPPTVPPVDVAALQARVAAFEAAEATRTQEEQARKDAELTESQRLTRDNEALTLKLARAEAIATHPVPAEYQSLVQGSDAASFLASAKLASELAAKAAGVTPPPPKPDPIPQSGTGASGTPTSGSLDEGADLYNSRHKKTS